MNETSQEIASLMQSSFSLNLVQAADLNPTTIIKSTDGQGNSLQLQIDMFPEA